MPVVTISRGIGTLGDEIGQQVAERLDVKCLGKELLQDAARRVNVPEPDFGVLYDRPAGFMDRLQVMSTYQLYLTHMHCEIRGYADGPGAVLLGRAAHIVLRDLPNVYSVRVVAPTAHRIARVAAAHDISPQEAHARIVAEDRRRSRYHKYLYDEDWDDSRLYHVVINTGMVDVDWAVEHIVWATAHMPRQPEKVE